MILDIKFHDSEPKQFQHVRKTILDNSSIMGPGIVIFFYDDMYERMIIPVYRIVSITTTNE